MQGERVRERVRVPTSTSARSDWPLRDPTGDCSMREIAERRLVTLALTIIE